MSDNKIVLDSSEVEKAKTNLKELSAQLGVTGNAVTDAEGKIKSMASALKAFNAAPAAGGLLLLVGAITGVAVAAKGFMDSFVESAASLQEMSSKTGIAVEQLSIMKSVANLSGTSMDTVTGAVVKFEKAIAASGKETSVQARAFKELGISTSEAGVSTEEYMSRAAEKLATLHDGWEKNNIVMALFGKTGTDINEFLADYAERGDMAAKVTTEQAQQAKEYERTMKQLSMTTGVYKNLIGSALLPVAKDLADEFLTMAKSVNKLDAESKEVIKNQIADWAFGIAKGLAAGIDVGIAFWNIISGVTKAVTSLVASMVVLGDVFDKVLHGDFKGAADLYIQNGKILKDSLTDAWHTASADSSKYYDLVGRAQAKFEADKGKKSPEDTRRKAGNIGGEGDTTPGKATGLDIATEYTKQTDALIKLREEYNKLYGVQQATAEEMMQVAIAAGKYNTIQENGKQLTGDELKAAQTKLIMQARAADAYTTLIQKIKDEAEARKTSIEIENKFNQVAANDISAKVLMQYGKTATDAAMAVNKFNIEKETGVLISLDAAKATKEEIDASTKRLQMLGAEQIALDAQKQNDDNNKEHQRSFAYGWEQAFGKYKDDANNAAMHVGTLFATTTKGMEDAFISFAKTGKLSFDDMTQAILADLIKIAAQKAAAGMMDLAITAIAMSANGNVFGGSGILKSADGNVFDSPTLHGYSGGIGMLGEAGPEAVMPLKRNASGQLGVVAQSGGNSGSTIQNNYSITVNGASNADDTANKVTSQIKMMQQVADSRVSNAKRIGGISNPVSATAF